MTTGPKTMLVVEVVDFYAQVLVLTENEFSVLGL